MIKRFKETNGLYIDKIYGQERLAFAHTDSSDLYDLVEWAERGGYPGSEIKFYDLETGDVYTPFQKKRDVMYGNPVYLKGYYYFLQADNSAGLVTIFNLNNSKERELFRLIQTKEEKPVQKCVGFSSKIGNTTYEVSGYYSDTATEILEGKMKRIIREDIKTTNPK